MSDQGFAGQRDYTSGTGEYNRLEFVFKVLAGGMATATLVQVIAVNPGTGLLQGTVDVQLLINQQDSLGNTTPHGIVYGLPFARIQAGTQALILDPAIGDIGVVVFSSRDISSAIANKARISSSALPSTGKVKTVNPGSSRQFDYSDGLYLFTVLSATQPLNYIQILQAMVNINSPSTDTSGNLIAGTGCSGSFTTPTGQIVTVQDGIITNIF